MQFSVFYLLLAVAAGIAIGFLISKSIDNSRIAGVRNQTITLLKEATDSAERIKRDRITEAKDEIFKIRQDAERDIKERRGELQRAERKIEQKEENLDRKLDKVGHKEEELRYKQEELDQRAAEIEVVLKQQLARLEEIAGMTREEAQEILLRKTEEEAQYVIGIRLKELEEKAKREAERKARDIIITAVQRCAVEHSSDATVSVVPLPTDDMKGRIIGREGRNIRAFETLTGVDLIVDDTPEAVTLSSFDPVRREIARLSLERLITDGRIHPARIEELIEKATRDVEEQIMEAGEAALLETGIKNMHAELIRTLGQLKFRFSYGQNALSHSLEVAHISGIIAAELGIDEEMARRAGLLHDLGKAVDHQVEGPHATIGADLAKRFGERSEIISAIAAHHDNVEAKNIYDIIVACADAISASRPGARRESLDAYIKRLEKLEELAQAFTGVSKAYAIQAGREVRVLVMPNNTDDGTVHKLAYDIARKIEEEMKYPGQIKVTVSREMRSTEYAK
ncbi:MAG: ribonuclease Y [Synergistaceae bacterium]|jgi:ribonuclease Y|nr:ribonuclease Y [Synergistaceae bacterium]